jgi:hypothetical protein
MGCALPVSWAYSEIAEIRTATGNRAIRFIFPPQREVLGCLSLLLTDKRRIYSTKKQKPREKLQAFGRETSNLANRDRPLTFFASPAQLLIVDEGRWKGMDHSINQISRLIDWSEPCAPAFCSALTLAGNKSEACQLSTQNARNHGGRND